MCDQKFLFVVQHTKPKNLIQPFTFKMYMLPQIYVLFLWSIIFECLGIFYFHGISYRTNSLPFPAVSYKMCVCWYVCGVVRFMRRRPGFSFFLGIPEIALFVGLLYRKRVCMKREPGAILYMVT